MEMLYNSDNYAVVQFDVDVEPIDGGEGGLVRDGFEIVDKWARKEMFIEGALAESFRTDVMALIETEPSQEEVDDFLSRYASLMRQPVVMH